MNNEVNTTRIHRASSTRNHSRALDALLDSFRALVLAITIATQLYGIYKNPNDNNANEIAQLVLRHASEVVRSVKRLRRR